MPTDPRVDAYLAKLPSDHQSVLGGVRARVRELVPDAVETISYGMPAFQLRDRFLLSYAGWKRHCSIYPIDASLLERHADAVRDHGRTRGALHFSTAQPLPDALLRDLVETRVQAVRGASGY